MLCRRSRSFTTITRMSLAEAKMSLRKVSAWASSLRTYSCRPIFETPSTSSPISSPNSLLSAARLVPVMTRFTQVSRVNSERMRANVVEAAEQCGIISLAEVAEPVPLERFLAGRDQARLLVFCDEAAEVANPVQALQAARVGNAGIDVLIGPEGGFAEEERALLLRQPSILRLALGPRILRADTAAVAALALVQAALGDWGTSDGPAGGRVPSPLAGVGARAECSPH